MSDGHMQANRLNMYMAFDGPTGAQDGAILVFAYTARQARSVAHGHDYCPSYIDTQALRLKEMPELRALQKSHTPHCVDTGMPICRGCELWGMDLDAGGYCESCREEIAT